MADEDPAHHLRAESEEMSSVLPVNSLNIYQAKEGFVDQRGGLKGVLLALALHAPLGDSLELGVDNRRQLVERLPVARAPSTQQPRDVRGVPGFKRLHFAEYSRFIALPPGGGVCRVCDMEVGDLRKYRPIDRILA